jgi:hypothetical protein
MEGVGLFVRVPEDWTEPGLSRAISEKQINKLQRIADKLGAGLGTISRTIAEKSATWQDFQKGQD